MTKIYQVSHNGWDGQVERAKKSNGKVQVLPKDKSRQRERREKWVGGLRVDVGFEDREELIVEQKREQGRAEAVTLSAVSDLRGTACLI